MDPLEPEDLATAFEASVLEGRRSIQRGHLDAILDNTKKLMYELDRQEEVAAADNSARERRRRFLHRIVRLILDAISKFLCDNYDPNTVNTCTQESQCICLLCGAQWILLTSIWFAIEYYRKTLVAAAFGCPIDEWRRPLRSSIVTITEITPYVQELIEAAQIYAQEGSRRSLRRHVQSIVDTTSRFTLDYSGLELLAVADDCVPGQRRRPRGSPAASALEITSFRHMTREDDGSAHGSQRRNKRPRPSSNFTSFVTSSSLEQGYGQQLTGADDGSARGGQSRTERSRASSTLTSTSLEQRYIQELTGVDDGSARGGQSRTERPRASSTLTSTCLKPRYIQDLTWPGDGSVRGGQRGTQRPRASSTVTSASLEQDRKLQELTRAAGGFALEDQRGTKRLCAFSTLTSAPLKRDKYIQAPVAVAEGSARGDMPGCPPVASAGPSVEDDFQFLVPEVLKRAPPPRITPPPSLFLKIDHRYDPEDKKRNNGAQKR